MLEKKRYRWDIQGLRALAVLAVVIFHIAPEKLPGGYLGVDIFFVISGYLIIGFICRDIFANKFSLAGFYVKRIKRLFPALLATILATIVVAYFYLLPVETAAFAKSVISTLLYVSNIFFYTQSDYFAADLKLAPLLHTWSLSVEEQFYILFPILLIAIIKFKAHWLQISLAIIAIASFILSEYLVNLDPSLAFFISPTRFWQFIVGGLLALNIDKIKLSNRSGNLIGSTGLFTLVICLFVYTEHTLFPGVNAIIPTAASLCVILAGSTSSLFTTMMSLPINRFFGNISYSLYLWHWPVIVFYQLAFDNDLPRMVNSTVMLLASILLGYLSWKFIELPFSSSHSADKKRKTFSAAVAVSSALILLMLFFNKGLTDRFSEQQLFYLSYMDYDLSGFRRGNGGADDDICLLGPTTNDIKYFNKDKCIDVDKNKYNVLLIGDSHAAHWNSTLQALKTNNQTVSQVTASGCRPLLSYRGERRCTDLMKFGFEQLITQNHFDRIIIAGRWEEYEVNSLVKTVEYVKKFTDDIVVIGRTLEYRQDLPKILATTDIQNIQNDKQNRYSYLKGLDNKFKIIDTLDGVNFVSLIDVICSTKTISCEFLTEKGAPITFDYGHFTHEGALEVAGQLEQQLMVPKATF
ncbi:acyltransferase family protein [Flavobacterium sp. W21_SRS_FM6]|uniref:acyltransferase family protein n=1 Tax=Flavobacterium sp. W21_SRS_FM6 TaxID=3240268 RepID=UPI003F90A683